LLAIFSKIDLVMLNSQEGIKAYGQNYCALMAVELTWYKYIFCIFFCNDFAIFKKFL